MQPQPSYPPQPYYYPPQQYPQPMMPAPTPEKQYPVPSGRRVPLIWAISLIVVSVLGGLLAIGGGLLRSAAPAPFGTTAYASSLAHDDGAWLLSGTSSSTCAFANGGLDAITTTSEQNFGPNCTLQNQTVTDFRLSVRLLPQAVLTDTLFASIFVRNSENGGVAFVVDSNGNIDAYIPNEGNPVISLSTDVWHSENQTGNTLVIQAQGTHYTLAMNNAQIYSGDLNGAAEEEPTSGAIGLGAVPSLDIDNEAIFADISLTTP